MAQLTSIGELRPDGSILLYDKDIDFRQKLSTPRRIQPSSVQKLKFAEWGLQWVRSSFISAIGKDDKDLYIRFWNGSYYVYYGFASKYESMLKASSKGTYFWRNIRKTKSYDKLGSLPLENDLQIDDTQLFKAIQDEMNQIVKYMYLNGVHSVVRDEKGKEFLKIVYAGETIFLAINTVA